MPKQLTELQNKVRKPDLDFIQEEAQERSERRKKVIVRVDGSKKEPNRDK